MIFFIVHASFIFSLPLNQGHLKLPPQFQINLIFVIAFHFERYFQDLYKWNGERNVNLAFLYFWVRFFRFPTVILKNIITFKMSLRTEGFWKIEIKIEVLAITYPFVSWGVIWTSIWKFILKFNFENIFLLCLSKVAAAYIFQRETFFI